MFFILSKFLNFIFLPIGILTSLLLYGIFTKNNNRQKKTIIVAFVFLFITANSFIVNGLLLLWEIPPTPMSQVSKHDVGIVLTGGLTNENKFPRENTYLGGNADRIGQAIQLYYKGKITKILISGGNINIIHTAPKLEIFDAARYLIISGVKPSDIYLDTLAKNTRENALNCSRILKKQFPNQKYILITSAIHLRRATQCFEKVGIKITPFGADYITTENRFSINSILPSEGAFGGTRILFHEWVGYVIYWIFGYL